MESLSLHFEPLLDDGVREVIVNGVDYHNIAATGRDDYYLVNFVLRSARGEVAGGLIGLAWGDWLQISYMWVAAPFRGRGQGRALLTAAEDYARERGCVAATLETHSPQARSLYERHGYRVFAELEGFPSGGMKTFLRKDLV